MIKIGQVFIDLDGIPFVIVKEWYCHPNVFWDLLSSDGKMSLMVASQRIENCKLLAEYPTWQEATNSPEFKGEELTFDELAKWAGAEIRKTKIFKREVSYFEILLNINEIDDIGFYDNGEIWLGGICLFEKRTFEQMKQIIIAGGLKDESE